MRLQFFIINPPLKHTKTFLRPVLRSCVSSSLHLYKHKGRNYWGAVYLIMIVIKKLLILKEEITCLDSCKCHPVGVSPCVPGQIKRSLKFQLIWYCSSWSFILIPKYTTELYIIYCDYPPTWPLTNQGLQSSIME